MKKSILLTILSIAFIFIYIALTDKTKSLDTYDQKEKTLSPNIIPAQETLNTQEENHTTSPTAIRQTKPKTENTQALEKYTEDNFDEKNIVDTLPLETDSTENQYSDTNDVYRPDEDIESLEKGMIHEEPAHTDIEPEENKGFDPDKLVGSS